MNNLTQEEVNAILELHEKWLAGDKDGKQANFSYFDLAGLCFAYRNLQKAIFIGANLCGVDLRRASLCGADLLGVSLRGASLCGADLTGADLTGADFTGADLCEIIVANIIISEKTIGITQVCPTEGSFIGYKKAQDKIIVLEITKDAKRSSATTKKCRCSKAKVIRIEELDGSISKETAVISSWNPNFVYKLGKIVKVDNFDTNRWNECSTGIHFFMDKEMAKQY